MVPAIWTAIIMDGPLGDVLRFLHSCGWECFELATEHLEQIADDPNTPTRIDELKALMQELSVSIPQAHAHLHADIAHPDEAHRNRDLRILERHLDCCAALGVGRVVIHPGGQDLATQDDFDRALALNVEGFRELSDHAGELGLRIGIENTLDSRDAHQVFGSIPEELLDLIARVNSPALGITFDTSHANVSGLDLGAAIRRFGDLIWCTHISDNDGSGDQHRMPGCGTIDWLSVMAALRGIRYEGILNLEIPGEEQLERELLAMKLRYGLEVTRWLIAKAS